MRNLLTKATGTAIAIAAAALLNSGSANAQALVIDDLSCKLFDSAMAVHTIFPPALGGDAVVQRVMTPSGNSKITCSGRLPAGAATPPNRAAIFSGPDDGNCGTGFGVTDDWHEVVTKSGRAVLTCHLNGQN